MYSIVVHLVRSSGVLIRVSSILSIMMILTACSQSNTPNDPNNDRPIDPEYAWPLDSGNYWQFISITDSSHIATIEVIGDTVIDSKVYQVIELDGPFYGTYEREHLRVENGYWYSYERGSVYPWANFNMSGDSTTMFTYQSIPPDTISTGFGDYTSNIVLVCSRQREPSISLNLSLSISNGHGPVKVLAGRTIFLLDSTNVER